MPRPATRIAGDAGLDTIAFNIPGDGVQTITLQSNLPTITDPVNIDGYTQPGSSPNTNPIAMGEQRRAANRVSTSPGDVDGTGLTLAAGASTVRGLVINTFTGSASIARPTAET